MDSIFCYEVKVKTKMIKQLQVLKNEAENNSVPNTLKHFGCTLAVAKKYVFLFRQFVCK